MSKMIFPGFCPTREAQNCKTWLSLKIIMPSVWNIRFRYVLVYLKKIIIIKHFLYKEYFLDKLNCLLCSNVSVQTAMAFWYLVCLEQNWTVFSWQMSFYFLWFLMWWTKQTTASAALFLCETQCLLSCYL